MSWAWFSCSLLQQIFIWFLPPPWDPPWPSGYKPYLVPVMPAAPLLAAPISRLSRLCLDEGLCGPTPCIVLDAEMPSARRHSPEPSGAQGSPSSDISPVSCKNRPHYRTHARVPQCSPGPGAAVLCWSRYSFLDIHPCFLLTTEIN